MSGLIRSVKSSSGANSINLMSGPEVDVIYFGSTPFCLSVLMGMPLRLVGAAQVLSGSHGVVIRSPNLDELDFVNLGTPFGSTGHQIGHSWSQKFGKPVNFYYAEPRQLLSAYRSSLIDGIACWEPFLSLAERTGGYRVFTADQINAPIYNVIAVHAESLHVRRPELEALVRSNYQSVDMINSGEIKPYLNSIRFIFDEEIEEKDYYNLIVKDYNWPETPATLSQVPDFIASFSESQKFLEDTQIYQTRGKNIDWKSFVITDWGTQNPTEPSSLLRVGYTDSTMCAAYHLSIAAGIFLKNGLDVEKNLKNVNEHIALLPIELREDAKRIRDLVQSNPLLSLVESRRVIEILFRNCYIDLFNEDSPSSFEAVIEKLYSVQLFGSTIQSIAHSIRVIGNSAVHRQNIGAQDLTTLSAEALTNCLQIWQWWAYYGQPFTEEHKVCIGKVKNKRCGTILKRSWSACPNCSTKTNLTCHKCGENINIAWKTCPNCGVGLD